MDGTLATITMFGGNFSPRCYGFCDGQLVSISQNTPLFSLIGTTFGGDGRTTCALPDLRGRTPIGMGQGHGLSPVRQGYREGNEVNALNISQLPGHTHVAERTGSAIDVQVTVPASTQVGTSATPTADCYLAQTVAGPSALDQPEKIYRSSSDGLGVNSVSLGGVTAKATVEGGTVYVKNTGNNQPFSIMQPSIGMNYIICMLGTFPSRS